MKTKIFNKKGFTMDSRQNKNTGSLFGWYAQNFIMFLLLVCFSIKSVLGQEPDKKLHMNFETGLLVAGFTEGDGGVGIGLKLNFIKQNRSLGAFYYTAGELLGPESVNYGGITYGYHQKSKAFVLDLAAGTGVVFGTHKGKLIDNSWFWDIYEKKPYVTMGIHGEMDLIFQPVRNFGIGTKLYLAFNPENPNYGMLFTIRIGY